MADGTVPTVLYEDNHCLAVDKPAGLLAQGDATGDLNLVDWASGYLRVKYGKPGNVYVGLVHRLDRPTSGVILLAKTSKAAARLSEQFRLGSVRKTYFAVCEAADAQLSETQGIWVDHLLKDPRTNSVEVVASTLAGGQRAEVEYRLVVRERGLVGVILRPSTGRGHQLRVQLSSRNLPILGDSRYGASQRIRANDGGWRIALHAAELRFTHPTRGETCVVQAPLPSDWPGGVLAASSSWSDSSMPTELPDPPGPAL